MNLRYWLYLLGLAVSWPLMAQAVTEGSSDTSQELMELHEQGRLTVRALAAWGLLSDPHWGLALDLRAQGRDLLSADRSQIKGWLDDARDGNLELSETQRGGLIELTAIMDLRREPEKPLEEVADSTPKRAEPVVDVEVQSIVSGLSAVPLEDLVDYPLGMFVAESMLTGDLGLLEWALGELAVSDAHAGEAIMLAAAQGDSALLDLLLNAGLPVDVPDADGWTPLMMAVFLDRTDAALHLMSRGANAHLETREGLSAVALAQNTGATRLLEAMGEPLSLTHAWRPIFAALERRDTARLRTLLSGGWPPNAADSEGFTALMLAARMGDVDAARMLLDAGAGVDAVDSDGGTALLLAIQGKAHAIVELLLAYGAGVDGPEGRAMAPLVAAILVSDEYVAHRLMDSGATFTPSEGGGTALDPVALASQSGMEGLVKRMETGDREGTIEASRIFEQVILADSPRVLEGLFSAGRLSPNDVIDEAGITIAMALVLSDPFPAELWRTALRAYPDIQVTDALGRNLLHFAAGRGMAEVVGDLIQLDLAQDSDARYGTDDDGRTVMMYAASSGVEEVIQTLLAAGIDPSATDVEGVTAAMIADSQGFLEVANLLRGNVAGSEADIAEQELIAGDSVGPDSTGVPLSAPDHLALGQIADAQQQVEDLLRQMKEAQRQVEEAQRLLEEARLQSGLIEEPAVTRGAAISLTAGGAVPPDAVPGAIASEEEQADALAVLTVATTPDDARVRIMNIRPRYRDGIGLAPGAYDIEVSAPGYFTYRRFHRLIAGEQVLRIELEKDVLETVTMSAQSAPARDQMRDGVEGPELVFVTGGTFQIGSPATEGGREGRHEQQTEVVVSDFWMTRHPITVQDYRRFLDATRYRTAAEGGSGQSVDSGAGTTYIQCEAAEAETLAILSDLRQGRLDLVLRGRFWRRPGFDQGRDHPVVCLTWREADAYARWLSTQTGRTYRLPTEAEWEYAARAANGAARPWGEQPELACRHANVADQTLQGQQAERAWQAHTCADGHEHTSPVGSFSPNGFGLHDMIGNVWEWTCSSWSPTYGGQEQRCANSGALRALRGGSWASGPDQARSASRREARVESSSNDRGFRLVRLP